MSYTFMAKKSKISEKNYEIFSKWHPYLAKPASVKTPALPSKCDENILTFFCKTLEHKGKIFTIKDWKIISESGTNSTVIVGKLPNSIRARLYWGARDLPDWKKMSHQNTMMSWEDSYDETPEETRLWMEIFEKAKKLDKKTDHTSKIEKNDVLDNTNYFM